MDTRWLPSGLCDAAGCDRHCQRSAPRLARLEAVAAKALEGAAKGPETAGTRQSPCCQRSREETLPDMVQSEPGAHARIRQLCAELMRVRARGVDDIDLNTHNQKPLELGVLSALAEAYCRSTGREAQP